MTLFVLRDCARRSTLESHSAKLHVLCTYRLHSREKEQTYDWQSVFLRARSRSRSTQSICLGCSPLAARATT